MSLVSVSVHPDPAQFRAVEFPRDQYDHAFVSLRLGDDVSLLVTDPDTLTALADLVMSARTWLAAEIAGQSPLPIDPEPVGDTGLTLHPLPVGVA